MYIYIAPKMSTAKNLLLWKDIRGVLTNPMFQDHNPNKIKTHYNVELNNTVPTIDAWLK